jgi:hypothetical protein
VQASQASRQLLQNLEAEGRQVTEFLLTVDQTRPSARCSR